MSYNLKKLLTTIFLVTLIAIPIGVNFYVNPPKIETNNVFAGVDMTSGSGLFTDANITPFTTDGVIYFVFNATSITQGTLLSASKWQVYLSSNKLYFYKAISGGSEDEGRWSVPISANTNYQVAIQYNHNSSESSDPVIYLNGVSQTVTEEVTPTSLSTDAAGILYVGSAGVFSDPLQGVIGDVALFQGTLTTEQLVQLTSTRLARFPLQISTLIHYWPIDEFPDGSSIASANTILPDSNVTTTWSSGTYTSVNASDNVYAQAGGSDDNETFQVGYGTFTLPAGESGIGFKFSVEGNNGGSSVSGATTKYKLGGGSNTTIGSCCSLGSDATAVSYSRQSLSQSQIDGFEGAVTVGTMGATDEINVDYMPVTIYSSKYYSLDYKGNTIKLQGFAGNGAAGKYLSY